MKRRRTENDNSKAYVATPLDVETYKKGDTAESAYSEAVTRATNLADRITSDNGHRYGNFHNYYAFHPVSSRTDYICEMLDYIATEWHRENVSSEKQTIFRYLDVGCNEGDLTLEVSKLLSDAVSARSIAGRDQKQSVTNEISKQSCPTICVTGLDLDVELIRRAEGKVLQQPDLYSKIQATFQVVDVLKDGILQQDNDVSTASVPYRTDLTTLFSTTMWIHIHGGDEGLRTVLQQICSCTRHWILLEPQPSKCYGTAAHRLRRLGLQPVDVSTERLQLRSNAEEAIESILRENDFERVIVKDKRSDRDQREVVTTTKELRCIEATDETRNPWNRSLRLYCRTTGRAGGSELGLIC
jgi:Bicoid-interacting protein 3 (Bin3)